MFQRFEKLSVEVCKAVCTLCISEQISQHLHTHLNLGLKKRRSFSWGRGRPTFTLFPRNNLLFCSHSTPACLYS